jgi:assimilatory nitrate reductase catalytic subunit
MGAAFLAPEPVAVSRAWACEQLLADHSGYRARMAVIAGRPGTAGIDHGALICSCFGVGANEIAAAIAQGCCTVETIGKALNAGTYCGSCRGEIRQLLDNHRQGCDTRHQDASPMLVRERVQV